ASLRECAGGSEIAFAAVKKIAVEREHNVGAVKSRNQSHIFAEAGPGRVILRLAQRRVVDAPHHFRKRFLQVRAQSFPCRRMHFFDQKRQTVSTICPKPSAKLVDVGIKLATIGIFAAIHESSRPRWIVKIENGGLREYVGGAGASGMKRIAFELDRPAVDRGRDQRNCAGAARHSRGVVKKFSWNRPLGALSERNEVHFRTSATC